MEKTNQKEHGAIFEMLSEIKKDIKDLPEKFILRKELAAIVGAFGFLSIILGIVGYFIGK